MKPRLLILAAAVAGCASAGGAPAGTPGADAGLAAADTSTRPAPYPVQPSDAFLRAIEARTRTPRGLPGPAYWQNHASYMLTARLDPESNRVEGVARIVYTNESPDTLTELNLDLHQNLHATGAIRFEPAEVTGGVVLDELKVGGRVLSADGASDGYRVDGTRLTLTPSRPLLPGGTSTIEATWSFAVPKPGAGARMGRDDDLFYIAYWYPQMTVYDDVIGWHPDPFVSTTEFYGDFSRYDVTVEAPAGWLITATGTLANADRVLAPDVLDRMRAAGSSDTVVHVVTAANAAAATTGSGVLRWRFEADSVRDFAFSATRASNWDAVRTPVGDRDGDGTPDFARIDAVYRASAPRWKEAARYGAHAIRFHSAFTGLRYPWPHMSIVEGGGIIDGGMEFPMMTLIGDYNERGDSALYYVVAHELGHMWIPMIVSNDERRHSWMDEGATTFLENQARKDFFPGFDHDLPDQQAYISTALSGMEGEIMRRSQYHYSPQAYGTASYAKPATVLVALRAVLGESIFTQAYRTYIQRWKYKHPYPWDMWNTFEGVSGRDLGWFWRGWYYETWTLDQAVGGVAARPDGSATITVEDHGLMPMPARLVITREDGTTLERTVPVETWLGGARMATVTVPAGPAVTRVEIDPERDFPDVRRANNVWSR
jgi:hypothetical protein